MEYHWGNLIIGQLDTIKSLQIMIKIEVFKRVHKVDHKHFQQVNADATGVWPEYVYYCQGLIPNIALRRLFPAGPMRPPLLYIALDSFPFPFSFFLSFFESIYSLDSLSIGIRLSLPHNYSGKPIGPPPGLGL